MVNALSLSKITGSPSFGSVHRTVFNEESALIKYRNNSVMFRSDLNWDEVVDNITKDDKARKIYCYACSDGSEPYSIAIALISKLGWEKAQKYFPIIAKDIDKTMIDKALSGTIDLSPTDLFRLERHTLDTDTKFFDSITRVGTENAYDKITHRGYISDKLKSCVKFSVGDICEDAKNLNYKDSILFFRNALPYLSENRRVQLLNTFSANLNDSVSIVIGAYDKKIPNPLLSVRNNNCILFEASKNFFTGIKREDYFKRTRLPVVINYKKY